MRTLISCFLFLCALLATGVTKAQVVDLSKIKQIPHFTALSQAEYEKKSTVFKEYPQGDKYLAFTVRLPEGWQKVSDGQLQATDIEKRGENKEKKEISRRIMGKVVQYNGPGRIDAPSRFEVNAMALDYNISARNWFLNYILVNSYTLQGVEEISDTRIESLYVLVEGDVSYIVRTVAEINGPRIILASYYLPEAHWNEERDVQEKAVQSFKFISPEQVKLELTNTYAFLDLLRFDYPVSWRLLAPEIFSIEGMNAKLINTSDNKTVNAEIGIHIVSTELDTTLAQEVSRLRDRMTDRGLEIGKLIEVPDEYKFHDHLYFNRVEIYEVKDTTRAIQDYEYWLAIMAEDRYYYIVTMLTIGRRAGFYSWARNSEAFKTVIESLRP